MHALTLSNTKFDRVGSTAGRAPDGAQQVLLRVRTIRDILVWNRVDFVNSNITAPNSVRDENLLEYRRLTIMKSCSSKYISLVLGLVVWLPLNVPSVARPLTTNDSPWLSLLRPLNTADNEINFCRQCQKSNTFLPRTIGFLPIS